MLMDSFLEGISSDVKIKSIDEAVDEAIESLKEENKAHYYKTGIEKLDHALGGGVEQNLLVTIGGISGSGKSAIANIIETNIAENYENVVVLNFSFEMTAKAQVFRKLSSKMLCNTSQLREQLAHSQSALGNVSDARITVNPIEEIRNKQVFYVEEAINVKQLCDIVSEFQRKCFEEKKWLVVFVDHALLIDGKSSDERTNVADLEKALIRLKKVGRTTIFQLMQLNRNIESAERRSNRLLHYPTRSDLSTADAVYQASDQVWVIHRPELLNIKSYGPHEIDSEKKVFLHIIKFREGEQKILMFENHLDINRMELPDQPEKAG